MRIKVEFEVNWTNEKASEIYLTELIHNSMEELTFLYPRMRIGQVTCEIKDAPKVTIVEETKEFTRVDWDKVKDIRHKIQEANESVCKACKEKRLHTDEEWKNHNGGRDGIDNRYMRGIKE